MSGPPRPRENPAYQAFLALVRVAALLFKAGDRFFRPHGLTQVQFNVLMALKHGAPEGRTQTELGRHLVVKDANMSALVRRMLARGLIRRADDPADTRAWRVTLAPQGRDLLRVAGPGYGRALESLMGGCSPRDARRFADMLRQAEGAAKRLGL